MPDGSPTRLNSLYDDAVAAMSLNRSTMSISRAAPDRLSMDPNDLLRVVIAKPYPPEVATT